MRSRKLLVIVNPQGGGRRRSAATHEALDALRATGLPLDIQVTRAPGHALALARCAELYDDDAIVAVGGDGTIHEVVNGLMSRDDAHRPPLGIVPTGTGNSLAHDLATTSIGTAVAKIASGTTRACDLLRLELSDRVLYAFNIVGCALPAHANALAERFRWVGAIRYDIAALVEIVRARHVLLEIEIADLRICASMAFVLACNTRHTGNGMLIAPYAQIADGFVDVYLVERATRFEMLKLLSKTTRGSHVDSHLVRHFTVKSFQIRPRSEILFNVDGEHVHSRNLKADVMPCELTLLA